MTLKEQRIKILNKLELMYFQEYCEDPENGSKFDIFMSNTFDSIRDWIEQRPTIPD